MSCIYKIREGMASYTDTEKKLGDYILQHADEVTLSSAQSLGEKLSVSAAAVVRFSQKLGYKGFTALKVDLARDDQSDIQNFDDMINENDPMSVVVKKAENLNTMLLNQAYQLLDVEQIEKTVQLLLNCRSIYLYGFSGSGIVCTDFMQKMSRINRTVVYHSDFHEQLALTAHITEQDVALAVSYSGKTHEVNTAMQLAKRAGASTVAITQFRKTPLTKHADILLYIPTTERELRLGAIASRNASLIITDLLYLGVMKNNMEQTREYLIKTKETIMKYKKS